MSDAGLEARYDAAAGWWQRMIHRLGYRAAYEDLMARALPKARPGSVIDVGTGSGDLVAAFCLSAGAPPALTLLDVSAEMLVQATATLAPLAPHAVAVHGTLGTYAPAAPFDLVLCAHVIEHTPDPGAALGDLARLVRPGGTLLLLVSRPHWCQYSIWLRWRHRWFSEAEVRAMAAEVGLAVDARFSLHSGPPQRTSFAYRLTRPN